MEILGGSIPIKSQEVVFRRVDEEMVFVPIRQSASDLQSIYTTNAVGARVWELSDDGRCVDDIAGAIASEYDVDLDIARADAEAFLGQLTEAGCVHWSDDQVS